MNTLAHAVLGVAVLGAGSRRMVRNVALAGSVVPDLPIFLFYGVTRFVLGYPESWIWRVEYFRPEWQAFVDVFNSVPLMVLIVAVALSFRLPLLKVLGLPMLLHVVEDLPLHHDDGHRHFFPLSDWRFRSPFSYWDPDHHGVFIAQLEMLAVALAAAYLLWRQRDAWNLWFVAAIAICYVGFVASAALVLGEM